MFKVLVDKQDLAASPKPPAHANGSLPPVEGSPSTEACATYLTAAALVVKGLPTDVSIRGVGLTGAATVSGGIQGRFVAMLRQPMPVESLAWALRALSQENATCLLLFSEEQSRSYRERIDRDGNGRVRIQRHFHRVHRGDRELRLVGAVWHARENGEPRTSARLWRELKNVMASGKAVRGVSIGHVNRQFDVAQHLVETLPEEELQGLARLMGYGEVMPGVFAEKPADISEDALLRGPLFIDSTATIGPDSIHIGPAWLRHTQANLTVQEPRALRQDVAHDVPADYFLASPPRQHAGYDRCKRMFDIFFALLVLTITLPICAIIALIIKLYDRGPIFFAHTREGLHGEPFGCIKFRTMVTNAEAMKAKLKQANQVDGPQFKIDRDPRITPIGRFLRKTNIDEVPQFLNVLMGQMSVVGPRPSPYEENQMCPAWREARLSVKPGITGLWQVSRSRQRGPADFQEWVFYDTQYVERRTFWLDMKIILLTIKWMYKGQ